MGLHSAELQLASCAHTVRTWHVRVSWVIEGLHLCKHVPAPSSLLKSAETLTIDSAFFTYIHISTGLLSAG